MSHIDDIVAAEKKAQEMIDEVKEETKKEIGEASQKFQDELEEQKRVLAEQYQEAIEKRSKELDAEAKKNLQENSVKLKSFEQNVSGRKPKAVQYILENL